MIYGWAGLVERMRREMEGDVKVVGTGGLVGQMREVVQCLQFVNPANGTDVRSETLSSLLSSGNSAIVAGTCTNSGVPCTFVADVTDSGPTGSGDTFTISISGGPARGGPLRSGKIQVRPR